MKKINNNDKNEIISLVNKISNISSLHHPCLSRLLRLFQILRLGWHPRLAATQWRDILIFMPTVSLFDAWNKSREKPYYFIIHYSLFYYFIISIMRADPAGSWPGLIPLGSGSGSGRKLFGSPRADGPSVLHNLLTYI